MCGICGYLGDPTGLDSAAMLAALGHRGPDGQGELRRATPDGELWLGHTRLAIIDLTPTGAQPMSTPDGVHTIVYNGELYNHRALRQELRSRGYEFRGTSDTEVLLYLLREEGIAGIDRLRGMFALAFWDDARKELLLARDPFGIKPLYYTDGPGRLAFASELRSLVRGRAAPRGLDPAGVESYLAFGCVTQPRTIIQDVRCVPPGGFLRRRAGQRAEIGHHYRFPGSVRDVARSYPAAVEQTAATLRRVVDEHMIADVPVGVLLSGGIDSSGLVALLAGAGRTVDTFTVVFGGEDESLSEQTYAAEVARAFASRHHEVVVTGSVPDLVGEAVDRLDRPSIDGANTYMVCQAVRRAGITVVQSGLGADEVFLGYGTHRAYSNLLRLSPLVRRVPLNSTATSLARLPRVDRDYRVQKALGYLGSDGSPAAAYAALRGLFAPAAIAALLGRTPYAPASFVTPLPGTEPFLQESQLSAFEIANYLANMLLRDSDAMSMAHGLELRVPYLDRDLVEHVLALPPALKLRRGRHKPLLVDAIHPPLPRAVVERRKRGFVLPFARWLRRDLYNDVADTFVDTSLLLGAGLDPRAARAVWRAYLLGHHDDAWTRPFSLHVLARWVRATLSS